MSASNKEEELNSLLKETTQEYLEAQRKFLELKKRLFDAETVLINTALNKERASEALQFYLRTTYKKEISDRDIEIQKYREVMPELMANNDFTLKEDKK